MVGKVSSAKFFWNRCLWPLSAKALNDQGLPNFITAAKVETASGNDANALVPVLADLKERNVMPEELLADTLYGEGTISCLKRRTGLTRLRVRGRKAVKLSVLLKLTAWNVLRAAALRLVVGKTIAELAPQAI